MQSKLIPSRPIDIHDIDDGVDRKLLTQLKQRFMDLNRIRYERTRAGLSDRQQNFLQLLPLLFHVNHPMLPGYISHSTPAGIYHYEPGPEELRIAKIFARSFHYHRDLAEKKHSLDALFLMGSVGTIAQSDSSDLDVWVCHSLDDEEAIRELERKCTLIGQWAEQNIHLEVHCFLMHSDDFAHRRGRQLSSEGSGSAQHFLLLDEFYRTALWLAGKVPLWWFVPASQEKNYAEYRDKLLRKRFIKPEDIIDFGALPEIPPNEFIGAGVWQLYKGIESPYKSVLKLLLLEAYASTMAGVADAALTDLPQTDYSEPLALTFKRQIYAALPDANLLDPYVMVYERLEKYLCAHHQVLRLELIRRCFYFKVNKALSRTSRNPNKSWQRQLLESMVNQWQWSTHQLMMLDNRAYWKAPHVINERALLVNELNQSYRLLNELHKNREQEIAISNEELLILGRKLHAAFERKAGKIEWINPGISRDLSEDRLCCIRDQGAAGDSWQLLRGSYHDLSLRNINVDPIKRSRSLIELLLWCHANQILTSTTKLDIIGTGFLINTVQKQQVLQALQQWLPLPLKIDHQDFTRPASIERLLLIINVGVEPLADLHKKGLQMLSNQKDALGYSGLRENLMINADVVQINSWGEVLCRHYASDALVNCLLHYFRLFPPGKHACAPKLDIRCFSSQGNNIAQRLTELWEDLKKHFSSNPQQTNCRYIFEMGDEILLLQFLHQQPQINRFKNYEDLLKTLGQPQTGFSPIVIDRYALRGNPLRFMCSTIKPGSIYIFYQQDNRHATVTLADERGSLFRTRTEFYNQQTLLRPLVQFIRSALQRMHFDGDIRRDLTALENINLYELISNNRQQQYSMEARSLQQEISQLHFINIKAIADMDFDELRFTIFCDEQEFSSLAYGDELFKAVASYIVRRRQYNERYPCYITDLDLSLCREPLAPQTGLQLGHYLKIKADLETQLNAALGDT